MTAKIIRLLFPGIDLRWLAHGLEKRLNMEVDFENEVRNMNKTQSLIEDSDFSGYIHVPEVCELRV